MKLGRTYRLLAGVALLGAIAAYIEMTRTTAQSSERAAATGESAPARTAARTPDPAVESPPSGGNVRTAARTPDAAVEPPPTARNVRTAARMPDAAVESPPSSGNPLWALPLKQLSTTRERPIFSPSRHPPPPATPTYIAPVAVRQPAKPAEPERPAITLLGTIIGTDDRIGVFLETATQNFVRLRVGDDHQGWVLRLIKAREVTLVKDREQVAVLELPAPGDSAMNGTIPGGTPLGGMPPGGMPPGGMPGRPPGGIAGLPGGMPGAVPGMQQVRRPPGR
jgi:general secretion pathway protein N